MTERIRPKLLVVDDGERYVAFAHELLRDYTYATRCELAGPCWTCPSRRGCTLTHAHDSAEADEALDRHADVDVVLLDVAFDVPEARLLPSRETDLAKRRRRQGLEILAHLRRRRADLPVVLMTSEAELRLEADFDALAADEMLTFAASDAFDARALSMSIERIVARRHGVVASGGYAWGVSRELAKVRHEVSVLARTSLPMLVLGETGTGKSALVEHVVHPASGRTGPFVSVDLGALPETLVAAELFGTARGAFSGALDRPGRFERANGGTLLLDEIGNLPLDLQRLLLLALERGAVTRLGENDARPVDVKLVAATHVDLGEAVRTGRFRADLYARLNPATRIVLPPLRDRPDDIALLLPGLVGRAFAHGVDRALLAEYAARCGPGTEIRAELAVGRVKGGRARGVVFALPQASLDMMREHGWPGNVRELAHVIRSATVFALADALTAHDEGRGARAEEARVIPISARLVRDLIGANADATGRASTTNGMFGRGVGKDVPRGRVLHDVARALERTLYESLFRETNGDFAAIAARLLTGDPSVNARRVRLRFNQLGLRARTVRRRGRTGQRG